MSVSEPSDDPTPCGTGGDLDCDRALAELERYLDGELPASELDTVRDHLAACYPCADRATFEEQLRAIVRERCAEAAPPTLVERIRSRLDETEPVTGS